MKKMLSKFFKRRESPGEAYLLVSVLIIVGCAAICLTVNSGSQWVQAAQQNDDITACIDKDSILRVPKRGFCPDGTKKVSLAKAEIAKPDDDKDKKPTATKSTADQIADIKQRIEDLERGGIFEVVNKDGDVMFRVSPDKVQLFNSDKKPAAEMLARTDDGKPGESLVVRAADGQSKAVIGIAEKQEGFQFFDGKSVRLELQKQPSGSYSFRVPFGDNPLAAIGESKEGTGALIIGDRTDHIKASMMIDNGKGAFNILNTSGYNIATITEGSQGGGALGLFNHQGDMRVKFGVNSNRYGVGITLPVGFPYVPKSGLPGSYMFGCSGGTSACSQ